MYLFTQASSHVLLGGGVFLLFFKLYFICFTWVLDYPWNILLLLVLKCGSELLKPPKFQLPVRCVDSKVLDCSQNCHYDLTSAWPILIIIPIIPFFLIATRKAMQVHLLLIYSYHTVCSLVFKFKLQTWDSFNLCGRNSDNNGEELVFLSCRVSEIFPKYIWKFFSVWKHLCCYTHLGISKSFVYIGSLLCVRII